MAETEAEKACRRADELFLAGDIAGARLVARRVQRISPLDPGLASMLATYNVHAAAAVANPDRPDWRAVLRVDLSAWSDAVKKQFRRLSLLVHPDKNRSAAAEGAFKLLRQAYDTLLPASAHYVPNAAAARDWYWRTHARKKYPAKAPASGAAADTSSRPRAAKPKQQFRIWCENCKMPWKIDPGVVTQGVRCRRCFRRLSHPWQGKAHHGAYAMPSKEEAAAAARPKPPTFSCPARCPRCGTQFTSMVSTGRWILTCKACQKSAIVDIQGPSSATCTRTTKYY